MLYLFIKLDFFLEQKSSVVGKMKESYHAITSVLIHSLVIVRDYADQCGDYGKIFSLLRFSLFLSDNDSYHLSTTSLAPIMPPVISSFSLSRFIGFIYELYCL